MGMIGNWGVHHLDIAQWGNGTDLGGPIEVEGKAEFPKDMLTDCCVSWQVENRYANGVTMIHMDTPTAKKHPLQVPGHGSEGVTFLGTEGWVHVNRKAIDASSKALLKWKPGANDVQLFDSKNHHVNFVDSVKGSAKPAAPIDVALRSDAMCHLQLAAVTLNRKLKWDPAKLSFVGDDEANRLLDRPMRAPWKI
jgi:predicted dehydrogenase